MPYQIRMRATRGLRKHYQPSNNLILDERVMLNNVRNKRASGFCGFREELRACGGSQLFTRVARVARVEEGGKLIELRAEERDESLHNNGIVVLA